MITIAILREAGLSDAQIIRILEVEKSHLSSGAERTRRWRENRKASLVTSRASQASQGVTCDSALSLKKEIDKKEVKKESTRSARGTRLPTGWTPSDPDWQFALTSIGEQPSKSNLDKFRDYWAAVPGQKGVKLDWGACWRNWVRRVAETTPAPPAPEPEGEWINGKSRWLHERELEVQRMLANGNHHQDAVLGGGSEIRGPESPTLFGKERPKGNSHH